MPPTNLANHVATGLALTSLLAFALGSSASSSAGGDGGATTTTSAAGDPTEIKVSVSGKTLPNYEYIRAVCNNPKEGTCAEFYGLIPKFTPEMCPREGGTFKLASDGAGACPKDHLVGTCHYIQSRAGEPGELVSYYGNSPEAKSAKAECNGANKEWIDAPVPVVAPSAAGPKPAAAKPAAKAPAAKKK